MQLLDDEIENLEHEQEPPDPHSAEAHQNGLGEFLSTMKEHLLAGGLAKATCGDYLRTLEYFSKSSGSSQPVKVIVGWSDKMPDPR